MKKQIFFLLLLTFNAALFSQDKKELKIDPVKVFLSTHDLSLEKEKLNIYNQKCLVEQYVNFLLNNHFFSNLSEQNTEVLIFEGEEYWLICLNQKDKTESEIITDTSDKKFDFEFLLNKNDGKISHFCNGHI